jgi:hypothetical protein
MHHKNQRVAEKNKRNSVHHPEALQHEFTKRKGKVGEQKVTSSLIIIVHKSAWN